MTTARDLLRRKNGYAEFEKHFEEKGMNGAFSEFIKSTLRHGLSGAGAVLVGLGIVEQSVIEQAADANAEIIVGTALFFSGPLLSAFGEKVLPKIFKK